MGDSYLTGYQGSSSSPRFQIASSRGVSGVSQGDRQMVAVTEAIVAAMDQNDLNECWRLGQRCFSDGEAYDRETFRYLLSHSQSICYKVVNASGEMIAFVVGMIETDATGHVVALG